MFQKKAEHVHVGTAVAAKEHKGGVESEIGTSVDVCTMRQEELGDVHEHFSLCRWELILGSRD